MGLAWPWCGKLWLPRSAVCVYVYCWMTVSWFTQTPALQALSGHDNISYRIYNPAAQRGGGLVMRELENLNDFARINHRMHNKLLVVDGRVAIMGGRNLADEYYGYQQEHNFRDFELLLSGPFVSELSEVFDLYWNDPWSLPIEDLHSPDESWTFESINTWVVENAREHLEHETATPQEWSALFSQGLPAQLRLIVDAPPDSGPCAGYAGPGGPRAGGAH